MLYLCNTKGEPCRLSLFFCLKYGKTSSKVVKTTFDVVKTRSDVVFRRSDVVNFSMALDFYMFNFVISIFQLNVK